MAVSNDDIQRIAVAVADELERRQKIRDARVAVPRFDESGRFSGWIELHGQEAIDAILQTRTCFNCGMEPTSRYPNPMAALDAAVAIAGSMAALGSAAGVGQSHVSMWKRRESVPAKYAPAIERATGGRVRCEDLCPDVDWGVLRNPLTPATAGAVTEGA
jgi:DNA-binding transcriptional regulator YdaS (Cro superfamily)